MTALSTVAPATTRSAAPLPRANSEAIEQDPEALAQLARLLGDESLRAATADEARRSIAVHLELLADGLAAEAAASDDVSDDASALSFLETRLRTFRIFLADDPALASRLWQALRAKINTW